MLTLVFEAALTVFANLRASRESNSPTGTRYSYPSQLANSNEALPTNLYTSTLHFRDTTLVTPVSVYHRLIRLSPFIGAGVVASSLLSSSGQCPASTISLGREI